MARDKDVYHAFRVEELKFESPKAFLFKLADCEEPVWIPKSQCDYDRDSMTVHASDWIVGQKAELQPLLKGL